MLLKAGVNVAIGVVDEYTARNTRFDLAWVMKIKDSVMHTLIFFRHRLHWNLVEKLAKHVL